MKKQFCALLSLGLLLLCQINYAENCPSVADIKAQHLHGWQAFDSDDGTPLSASRESKFKKNIEEFALAEWTSQSKKMGSIHCYYRDHTGSSLEAYLAKDNFKPINHQNYWYEVSGYMHCAAGMDKCEFAKNNIFSNEQLAKK